MTRGERDALICLRYSQGIKQVAIAAEFGLSQDRVSKILKHPPLELRSPFDSLGRRDVRAWRAAAEVIK